MDDLEPLLGEWRMEAVFASGSPAADLEQEGMAQGLEASCTTSRPVVAGSRTPLG